MKKHLLILAGAVLAAASASAESTPTEYPGLVISAISPNGQWAVSSDESNNLTVLNLSTGQTWEYGPSIDGTEYSAGLGRCVSNDGIVVASSYDDDQGYYWVDGAWYKLPIKDTDFGAIPMAITPDGSRIAGSIGHSAMSIDFDAIMNVPAVWNRNDEGGYDLYVEIPHPATDWTGRVPQYVLVDDMSADGTVLAGNITDYSGFTQQPIVFTEAADGTWSYNEVGSQFINPGNVEFPPYPGEAPEEPNPTDYMSAMQKMIYQSALDEYNSRPLPEPTDFMSSEELVAYYEAMDAYNNDWENNPYPFYADYMTEEEYAAYQDAEEEYWSTPAPNPMVFMSASKIAEYQADLEQYNTEYAAWDEAYNAFSDVMWEVMANPDVVKFSMNSARISPNGQYYIMTAEIEYEDPNSWFGYSTGCAPYIFDLANGTATAMDKGQTDIYATQVTDDAYVLGGSPSEDYTRNGYIAQGIDAPFVQLYDVIKEKDAELGAWIEENMTHTVYSYDYDWENDTEIITSEDKLIFGTPVANDDLSIFASWAFNSWDMDSPYNYYSYVLPVNGKLSGIGSAVTKASALSVDVDRNGVITLTGAATNVTVYDIEGREVFTLDSPASKVTTRLANGTYVVKATAADGSTVTRKAVF